MECKVNEMKIQPITNKDQYNKDSQWEEKLGGNKLKNVKQQHLILSGSK